MEDDDDDENDDGDDNNDDDDDDGDDDWWGHGTWELWALAMYASKIPRVPSITARSFF